MLTSKSSNFTTSLRFRRWSRKNYAVFASLKFCVTIGCLANSITEKSLTKAKNYLTQSYSNSSTIDHKESDVSIVVENILEQYQEIIINKITADNAAAACHSYF